MSWQIILGSNLAENWLFSAPITGEWFRISAAGTGNNLPPYGFWGYIGQARSVFTANPDFYSVRRLYPFDNKQVMRFLSPPIWGNDRAICLKGINYRWAKTGFPWFVKVEVWAGALPPDTPLAPPGIIVPGII